MDYKKKSLNKLSQNKSYEEIDTRLASGWYVNDIGINKKKKYKTKEVTYKISKQLNWFLWHNPNKQFFIINKFSKNLKDYFSQL